MWLYGCHSTGKPPELNPDRSIHSWRRKRRWNGWSELDSCSRTWYNNDAKNRLQPGETFRPQRNPHLCPGWRAWPFTAVRRIGTAKPRFPAELRLKYTVSYCGTSRKPDGADESTIVGNLRQWITRVSRIDPNRPNCRFRRVACFIAQPNKFTTEVIPVFHHRARTKVLTSRSSVQNSRSTMARQIIEL